MTKEREKTIRRIIDLTGRIDVLVHAAATYAFETADSLSEKNMKREFEVNTLLPLLVTQEVYRQHWSLFSKEENEKKRHAVIVIGSQAGEGKTSRPELITYSATKAALKVAWEYYGDFLESKGIRSVVLKPGSLKENDNLSRFLTHLKAEIA